MGFNSMLLQVIVLRNLLSVFSGNELDIGITLSFWLFYVGLGSMAGKYIKIKNAFAISFIVIGIISFPTIIGIRTLRSFLGLSPGEIIPLSSIFSLTALILLPLCFSTGIQFPLAVSGFQKQNTAGKIYGLEAIGAFMSGSAFTFIIAGNFSSIYTILILSLISILAGAYISGKKLNLLFLGFPLIYYLFVLYFFPLNINLPGFNLIKSIESKYGEIQVIQRNDQKSLFVSGQLQFSYPDFQTEELNAHLAMTMHKSPFRILLIGGSPGILRELIKYPVMKIDYIEIDPEIVKISKELIKENDKSILKDFRISFKTEDGRYFIKNNVSGTYDLIMLNIPPPSTAGLNRFYTQEFFLEVKKVLKYDGLLMLSLPVSFGYMSKSVQTLNGTIYKTLDSVFNHVEVTSQEYGKIFASDSLINTAPSLLSERFLKHNLQTGYFHSGIFDDAFEEFDIKYVKERISRINNINKDTRPLAYFYNLMLWDEIQGTEIFLFIQKLTKWHLIVFITTIFILSLLFLKNRKKKIYFSMFITGFYCMTLTICLILGYQAIYGYVYEKIGLLSGLLMIGLWIGTKIHGKTRDTNNIFLILDLLSIAVCILFLISFRYGIAFYLIILSTGIVTGKWFASATKAIGEGGSLYGIELIGSFIGAISSTIVLIPLFGFTTTIILLISMKAISALFQLHFGVNRKLFSIYRK